MTIRRHALSARGGAATPTAYLDPEPLGRELGCRVDGGQPKLAGTRVGEPVITVGRRDDELTGFADELGAIDVERRLASFNHKHFWVRMPMHVRAHPRRTVHQDERNR